MSLAAICSANLHQLRSSFGNTSNIRLLQIHCGLIYDRVVDNRRSYYKPLSTGADGRSHGTESSQPCSINLNLQGGVIASSVDVIKHSDIQPPKLIQYNNFQESVVEKNTERHATILAFDIETTGLHRTDRIIEFAIRDLMGGKNSTFETLINPERAVTNSEIHKITSQMVRRSDVPRFKEFIPILLDYVRSRQVQGKPVVWVAHNGKRFDVPFIIKEFQRCKVEVPEDWLIVDTLYLARELKNPDGSKLLASTKLEALVEHYGIQMTGPAHRAMSDVTALCYVLQRLTFDLKITVPQLIERASEFRRSGAKAAAAS